MTYKRKQLPKYCRHKASGQAYVRIAGDMHYLGKHGSDVSRREYDRIMGEYIANGRQAFRHPDEILVESLIVRYLDYVDKVLNLSKGRKGIVMNVLRCLNDLYGKQPVAAFGPTALKTLRQQWVEKNLGLDTINNYIGTIKQVFDWGACEEIIPADVANVLRVVKPLQKGRTTAVEYADIEPVADAIVEKTLPYLEQQERDMVLVQRRISGRPQDIYNMRSCDIDMSNEVWKYTPFTHKTKKKGKIRELPVGPRAQQILAPYLARCQDKPDQFIFVLPDGRQYDGDIFGYRIAAACKKAGVPKWTPNQLRHAGGTEVRNKFGLDYAQVILGHASAKTTEIYAKASFDKAAKVAREIG